MISTSGYRPPLPAEGPGNDHPDRAGFVPPYPPATQRQNEVVVDAIVTGRDGPAATAAELRGLLGSGTFRLT
ncbi:hypothetical protein ACWDSJ_01025 [Nocardia sp. NPDC003482]